MKKKDKIGVLINLIGIVILIGLLIFGVGDAEKQNNTSYWEPDEVYEFCNKNISWD